MLERSSRRSVDAVVIGAGVVGCAIARVLARGGRKVALLDREDAEGRGISARNSGVIHSGIYGRPGTRKARSCVRGRELLYAFAEKHDIPHRKTGKLIVARRPEGREALEKLAAQAEANAVAFEWVEPARALALEPALEGAEIASALFVPEAGIIDAHAVCSWLRKEAEASGAFFAGRAEVSEIEIHPDRAVVRSGRGPIDTERVINCAGLYADDIAALVGLRRPILPCRGDYFRLRPRRAYQRLVYPAVAADPAGLGVHLTLELDGGQKLGPDAQWVLRKDDFGPRPDKREAFLASARALLGPHLEAEDLAYDGCGIRPKRHGPNEPGADFEILATERCVHLLGIESPGLTAAMALAEEVGRHLRVPVD